MKFIGLLLSAVIFVAIIYQTVLTPMSTTKQGSELEERTSNAIKALHEADNLKKILNKQNKTKETELYKN